MGAGLRAVPSYTLRIDDAPLNLTHSASRRSLSPDAVGLVLLTMHYASSFRTSCCCVLLLACSQHHHGCLQINK